MEWGWGQEHTKSAISPKWCEIGPRLLAAYELSKHEIVATKTRNPNVAEIADCTALETLEVESLQLCMAQSVYHGPLWGEKVYRRVRYS